MSPPLLAAVPAELARRTTTVVSAQCRAPILSAGENTMSARNDPIGSHFEAVRPARVIYIAGPRDGQEGSLEVSGGIPTVVAVDEALGIYVRGKLLPDGRWLMTWRPFE